MFEDDKKYNKIIWNCQDNGIHVKENFLLLLRDLKFSHYNGHSLNIFWNSWPIMEIYITSFIFDRFWWELKLQKTLKYQKVDNFCQIYYMFWKILNRYRKKYRKSWGILQATYIQKRIQNFNKIIYNQKIKKLYIQIKILYGRRNILFVIRGFGQSYQTTIIWTIIWT